MTFAQGQSVTVDGKLAVITDVKSVPGYCRVKFDADGSAEWIAESALSAASVTANAAVGIATIETQIAALQAKLASLKAGG
jgi:hypothetical protein